MQKKNKYMLQHLHVITCQTGWRKAPGLLIINIHDSEQTWNAAVRCYYYYLLTHHACARCVEMNSSVLTTKNNLEEKSFLLKWSKSAENLVSKWKGWNAICFFWHVCIRKKKTNIKWCSKTWIFYDAKQNLSTLKCLGNLSSHVKLSLAIRPAYQPATSCHHSPSAAIRKQPAGFLFSIRNLLSALLLAHFMSCECKLYHSFLCMKVFILPRWFLQGLWQRVGVEKGEWMWVGVRGMSMGVIPNCSFDMVSGRQSGCVKSLSGVTAVWAPVQKFLNF